MKLFYKEIPEHEYGTYPRRFERYRWFKPLFTGAIALVIFLILANLITGTASALSGNIEAFLESLRGGYDTFDSYSAVGALATLGSIAVMIPSLFIASKIVRDRPFSSYGSAMGGFRISVCLKALIPALIALAPSILITVFSEGRTGETRFSAAGLFLCIVLGTLQCVAEEYMFRGFILQTVGSWTKVPLLGVLIQVLVFALLHPYNTWGLLSVIIMGLTLGFLAVYTKGLEAGSALHIVNNLAGFLLSGFGFGQISSEVGKRDVLISAGACAVMIVLTVLLKEKFHFFDKVKKDDVEAFNMKYPAKERA